jgi:ribosomal protein S27AE
MPHEHTHDEPSPERAEAADRAGPRPRRFCPRCGAPLGALTAGSPAGGPRAAEPGAAAQAAEADALYCGCCGLVVSPA